MLRQIRPAIVLLALFSVLTGLVYPLAITGVAQAVLPLPGQRQPAVDNGGAPVGSALIGQNFAADKYFHGRPSATQAQDPAHPDDPSKTIDAPYNAANSTGSNLGPTSQKLLDRVKADVEAKRAAGWTAPIPADSVTTSASGLDPIFRRRPPCPGSRRRQGAQAARGKGARARRGEYRRPHPSA